jgi:hypothetical protein
LVGTGGRTAGLEAFGQAVQAVLGTHPDLASEQCWQQLGQLVAQHWVGLCKEQAPMQTWGMLAKCSETIVRVRRAQAQDKGQSGADALEEFRVLMRHVTSGDEET